MKQLGALWKTWRQDRTLGTVLRNTGYLFSSNSIAMILSPIQGFLAAFLLGPANYGVLGMIILLGSTVNRLLSFRMNELVLKYAGQDLAVGNRQRAAAVVKAAGLTEALTSVFATGILAVIAPWAARVIIKDPQAVPYILVYGVVLLANLVTETSTAVLQIGGHFRSQAALNVLQYGLTTTLVVIAYFTSGGFLFVFAAYMLGKLVYGVGIAAAAARWIKPMFGSEWSLAAFRDLPDRRALARFAVSTNLSGTVNMVIRDSEVLWVGYFLNKTEAGYYNFARNVVIGVMMPITPMINALFPEMSKFVARRDWQPLRSILRRTTAMALVYSGLVAGALALLGKPVLAFLKNGAYLPSLPVVFILLLGYAAANIVFWNRAIMLSFDRPNAPLLITAAVGAVKTALLFVLVRPYGMTAQAWLLSGYFVITSLWITWRALAIFRQNRESEAA